MMQPPSWLPQAVREPLDQALGRVRRQSYAPLPQKTEADRTLDAQPRWTQRAQQMVKRRPFVTLTGLVLAVILLSSTLQQPHGPNIEVPLDSTLSGPSEIGHVFYTFIPVNTSEPDPELCKTIVSTEILGYPPPELVYHDNDLGDYVRQVKTYMGKINRGLKEANAVALVLDSPSAWFQLRPEVMLDRYFRLLADENARLHRTISPQGRPPTQKVVFGASNVCETASKDECVHAPIPPPTASSPDHRFLDAALAIGPMEHLHDVMARAVDLVGETRIENLKTYKALFGQIFLEQEKIRSQADNIPMKGSLAFGKRDEDEDAPAPSGPGLLSLEYGIALDYQAQLGMGIMSDADSLEWTQHPKLSWIMKQIATTMPPFWTITGQGVPLQQTWHDINLLTNTKTNSIPAMVSLDYDKTTEGPTYHKSWWPNMWFQPYARKLYDHVALRPNQALAKVVDPEGRMHVFWRRQIVMEKAGGHNATNRDHFLTYRAICSGQGIADEVFGDHEGDWKNPAP